MRNVDIEIVVVLFLFVKSRLELVRVTREISQNRHRRHPSRRGLAHHTERLRAGYIGTTRGHTSRGGDIGYSSWPFCFFR